MQTRWRIGPFLIFAATVAWSCGYDATLRAYLDARFWLPFSKHSTDFERRNVKRADAPFAGMTADSAKTSLARLRTAYQEIAPPDWPKDRTAPGIEAADPAAFRGAVASARSDRSLSAREREEIDLIDAKIAMRFAEADKSQLPAARMKMEAFLKTAHTQEFLSEARGWLAHIYHMMGDQGSAGKIYLDELNRDGSNLSRETILTSLQLTYGYDGGAGLRANLADYFDTPQHAAFAIQLTTNPHWTEPLESDRSEVYARVKELMLRHEGLLRRNSGSSELALLLMRTALRFGDPAAAAAIAEKLPSTAPARSDPDFLWMLGSSRFLSRDYAASEQPLLALFRSAKASQDQKAAAAYALCGVYQKLRNIQEQLRFALWLDTTSKTDNTFYVSGNLTVADMSLYWAPGGWDLSILLDSEASMDDLQTFIENNPKLRGLRTVQYSLAVRLARENRYRESADIYQAINAIVRAPRMGILDALYKQATGNDLTGVQKLEAQYKLAEFLAANSTRVYFNDLLWHGWQDDALRADHDTGLTGEERQRRLTGERELRDQQEEYWRAYQILSGVVRESGHNELGNRAAKLALRCLRRIGTNRFGHGEEIEAADIELSHWLEQK
jgi:hypothetical protein